MLTVVILICLKTVAIQDCNYVTAVDYIRWPVKVSTPYACIQQAESYLGMSPLMEPDEYPKIVCLR